MPSKLQAPRGTYDVLPEQAAPRRALEQVARRVLEGAGYERVETPVFEATELFARGVGASTDIVQKEMYTFKDAGDRSLTLRPEGTAPICRAYMQHGMQVRSQPVKLWYLSQFFRYERAQAGRFRQFWQVGAEAIGSDDPAVDAECIALLWTILTELGVGGIELRLGSLGTPETRASYREELTAYLRAHEEQLSPEVVARIDLNPLRAFDADHPGTKQVMAGAPVLMDALAPEDLEHFEEVRGRLDAAGIGYRLDPTLVRGLDYYSRTLFEFTSDVLGAQSAVGGGGRYDGLMEQLGGTHTPACGWAAGVERMLLSAEHRPEPHAVCDLYVAGTGVPAFALAVEARRAGLNVQLELAGRSRKGQRKQASRLRAAHVALVEDDGSITVEDVVNGETEAVPGATAAVAHILKGRHL
ncbi:MAG: histidyl-tRNA synthetase [Solirubrobacterales bacterium]|nr:histidyl-tRNA synthetase [Solirubrobacterales bacterium]